MTIRAVRGTRDILPDDVRAWQAMEGASHLLLRRYGYREIRTPMAPILSWPTQAPESPSTRPASTP